MKKLRKLLKSIKHYLKNYRQDEPWEITWEEAEQKKKEADAILVDVRSIQEYEEQHENGAICIPHYEMQAKAEKMLKQKNRLIILYCQTGTRSKKAYNVLEKLGYTNVFHIKDGLNAKNRQT